MKYILAEILGVYQMYRKYEKIGFKRIPTHGLPCSGAANSLNHVTAAKLFCERELKGIVIRVQQNS